MWLLNHGTCCWKTTAREWFLLACFIFIKDYEITACGSCMYFFLLLCWIIMKLFLVNVASVLLVFCAIFSWSAFQTLLPAFWKSAQVAKWKLNSFVGRVSSWCNEVSVLFRVQHLSLRYNGITDVGAEHIGSALGTAVRQNQKLSSLNLAGNKIGDVGATHIACVRCKLKHIVCLSDNKPNRRFKLCYWDYEVT